MNEEPKQRAKNYMSLKGALEPKQIKCYCGHTTMCDCSPIDEPKQETLEEAAVNCWAEGTWDNRDSFTDGFVEGAKWMQDKNKNKYSEEDMLDFAWYLIKNVGQYSDDRIAHFEGKYLEQFKKK